MEEYQNILAAILQTGCTVTCLILLALILRELYRRTEERAREKSNGSSSLPVGKDERIERPWYGYSFPTGVTRQFNGPLESPVSLLGLTIDAVYGTAPSVIPIGGLTPEDKLDKVVLEGSIQSMWDMAKMEILMAVCEATNVGFEVLPNLRGRITLWQPSYKLHLFFANELAQRAAEQKAKAEAEPELSEAN